MRRFFLIGALVLGGCPSITTNPTPQLNIQSVQSIAVAACAFLPTADTVANLIAANVPALNTAEAIAAAICAAVVPKAGAPRLSVPPSAAPTVDGVVIYGGFTNGRPGPRS